MSCESARTPKRNNGNGRKKFPGRVCDTIMRRWRAKSGGGGNINISGRVQLHARTQLETNASTSCRDLCLMRVGCAARKWKAPVWNTIHVGALESLYQKDSNCPLQVYAKASKTQQFRLLSLKVFNWHLRNLIALYLFVAFVRARTEAKFARATRSLAF